jgi:hypothetical protein
MKISLKISVILACLVILDATLPGCVQVRNPEETRGPATLSEVVTATAVSPEGKALSDVTKFIATTPTIYLSAKVNNAPENTQVSAKWVYVKDETGSEVNQELFNDSTTVKGIRYVSFSHEAPSGLWDKGSYHVAVSINGKEVTDVQFIVKEVHAADVPYPTIQYFKAVPEALNTGQSVTLSWNTSGADRIDISPSVGSGLPGSGSKIVTPPNSMEYTLTASNNAGTTTKKITVKVTSFISDLPELVITDFWTEGTTAYYKIKNISEVNAKSSKTFLYVQGYNRASSFVDVLAAGQERTQSFLNYEWTFGSRRSYNIPIRVCADGLNEILEYDENNNCLEIDW